MKTKKDARLDDGFTELVGDLLETILLLAFWNTDARTEHRRVRWYDAEVNVRPENHMHSHYSLVL